MPDIERMNETLLSLGGTYLLNHARRTLKIAETLAGMENLAVDNDALVFSCYFHDISAFPPYRPDGAFDHAEESAKLIPALAREYGIDEARVDLMVEMVKYHDKRGMGKAVETMLLRNADAIDYLGFMAAARDFSKQPKDMRKAVAALKKHREGFAALLEMESAKWMAEPRIRKLDLFLTEFEEESFGLY